MKGGAIVAFVLLAFFTAWLVRYYAAKGTHFVYLFAVFVSWFMGFFGTLLLPVDVEETIEREPLDAFEDIWEAVYWSTFMLSWGVLPVLMEFHASGEFSFKQRLLYSLKANLKFYAIILVAGAVVIIWMAIYNSLGPSALSATLIACANTYGMLLIVVMMGYGLVETPRIMWNNSSPEVALKRLEYMAPGLEEQLFDARQDVDECVAQAMHMDGQVSATRHNAEDVELRRCMDVVMAILPQAAPGALAAMRTSELDRVDPTFKTVGKLHTRLKSAIPRLNKCQARWDALLVEAAELQAIIDGADQPTTYDSSKPEGKLTSCWRRARWFYKSRMNQWCGKLFACLLSAMSALVLWCELAIPLPWDLSLFGIMIGGAKGAFAQQFLCFVPFVYMSWCMYLALFRVKLLSAISLTPNRLTNAYALMFNASYLCRLQFVLAFNYLLVIKTDALSGHKTAFEHTVGANMELVPIFGTDFNNFIPWLLLVFALFTLFRVVDRIVRKVGIEGFGEYVTGRADHEERREEGREMIRKAQDRGFRRVATTSARSAHGRPSVDPAKVRRAREMAAAIRNKTYTPPLASAAGNSGGSRFSNIL